MPLIVLTNAFLIDGTGKEPVDGAAVVVEGERIKDVIRSGKVGPLRGKVETVDLRGRTLMPGLTDAHVHMCAVEGNTAEQHRHNPPSLIAAKTLRRMEQALQQGFTTVRDAGGADYGFREAVASGLYPGPRMVGHRHLERDQPTQDGGQPAFGEGPGQEERSGRCARRIPKGNREQLARSAVLNVDPPIGDVRRRRSLSCESEAEQHEAHNVLEDGRRPHTLGRVRPLHFR